MQGDPADADAKPYNNHGDLIRAIKSYGPPNFLKTCGKLPKTDENLLMPAVWLLITLEAPVRFPGLLYIFYHHPLYCQFM